MGTEVTGNDAAADAKADVQASTPSGRTRRVRVSRRPSDPAKAALKRRSADRVEDDPAEAAAPAYTEEQYAAAYAEARREIDGQIATTQQRTGAIRYLAITAAVAVLGAASLWHLNGRFAQELYSRPYAEKIAEAFDNGSNFGVFDLNIDIRNLRDAHLARLDETPDVVLLGASHWQEADVDLVTDRTMYNAHIHRDYYEDPLAMIEMLERHDRLPDTLILTIRDNQFTPVAERTDFLWLPGIPYYRRMAKHLGIEAHHPVETAPVTTWRDRLSLDILTTNVRRWMTAEHIPGPTQDTKSPGLDILMPGGSIVWSEQHDNIFTPERTRQETLDFAAYKIANPPVIDPKGVDHIETLLEYLNDKGVRVYLAHPPYNPLFWETVEGTAYTDGLKPVTDLVQGWADRFGWEVVGSFNPHDVGCTLDQYIDSEHSSRECLGGIFQEFMAKDRAYHGLPPLDAMPGADKAPGAPAGDGPAGEADAPLFVAAGPSPDREADTRVADPTLARTVGLEQDEATVLLGAFALRGLYD